MILLRCEGLEKSFAGIKALSSFSCEVNKGEILGLIGPNGAGKTTLFNVLTGITPANGGKASFHGQNLLYMPPFKIAKLGISRTFQILRLIKGLTVIENVLLSFEKQSGERLFNVYFGFRNNARQEAENKEKAVFLLNKYGLSEKHYDPADNLSYGQQKLLCLVCCLAMDAELILLDEPVAGIAPEMVETILSVIRSLPEQGKSIILIEHDMSVISNVCNRVIFMDAGAKISEGTPGNVLNDPKVIEAYLH